MGDKNQLLIFDIDKVLDDLEDSIDLINQNQETFSTIQNQQKIEITRQQQQQQDQIKSTHIATEENGNKTATSNIISNDKLTTSISNEKENKEGKYNILSNFIVFA